MAIAPTSWSADGRFIAYTLRAAFPRTSDVWILPLFGDRKPFPLVHTNYFEGEAVFSPDGRWIAYTTDDSGQPNVFVQPFPEAGEKLQVSTAGGSAPIWRADGKELYYLGADSTLMAVPIDTTGRVDAGTPQALFPTGMFNTGFNTGQTSISVGQTHAVSKDGQRFLLNARTPQSGSVPPLNVVVNWMAAIQTIAMALTPGTRLGPYEVLATTRRRRHGRGLSGARHEAGPRRRAEDAAGVVRQRRRSGWRDSSAKPRRWRRSTIPTSPTFTASSNPARRPRW